MSESPKEVKVARKPRLVEIDEIIWRQAKSAAALKGMNMSQAIEEAIGEWLAE